MTTNATAAALPSGEPARGCDHCSFPAVFRLAIVAMHSDDLMAEIWFCTERFQEFVANEPDRLIGAVNVTAKKREMIAD